MIHRRNPDPTRTPGSPRPRLAALTVLAVPLVGLALATPADALTKIPRGGTLDLTFGQGGKATHTPPGYSGQQVKLAVDHDGKIIVPGNSRINNQTVLRVTRFENDGDVDLSFGTEGSVLNPYGAWAQAVAVQPDGKIVVAGATSSAVGDFLVARYTHTGALDTSFGGDGIVVTDFSGRRDFAVDLALQPDGKIVVAGETVHQTTYNDYALARYTPTGELDTTFGGGDGKVTQALTDGSDWPRALALQPDGALVVTGTTEGGWAIGTTTTAFATARFTSTGSLDPGFDGDGIVFTDAGIDERGGAVALQSDGKVVIGGNTWREATPADEFAVIRYDRTGALDRTFSEDGMAFTDIGAGADMLGDIVVQTVLRDGRLSERVVAAGWSSDGSFSGTDFGLARYDPAGNLDPTFGTAGKVITDFGGSDGAHDVLMQQDKILAVGDANINGTPSIAMARYHGGSEVEPDQCPHMVDDPIEPEPCPGPGPTPA